MFYLSRSGAPVPADAPYSAHLNERKEWEYNQQKHQEALRPENVKGLVDRKKPKSIDPPVQSIQARTRRFQEDWKKAEIGRENRKLVDKLNSIAKTHGSCGPPLPLTGGVPSAAVALLGSAGRTMRPSATAGMPPTGEQRSRSLNDNYRRKVQRGIDQDNAGLVRRILSVKSTFNPRDDEKHFQRHKRAVNLLQRLPDKSKRNPRSLPPLRRDRPNSNPHTVQGLEALFFPGDLQRSESGPGALDWRPPGGSDTPDNSTHGHAATAPLMSTSQDGLDRDGGGVGHAGAPAAAAASAAPILTGRAAVDPGATGPVEEVKHQGLAGKPTGGAFPRQSDSETERRKWTAADNDVSPKEPSAASSQKVGIMAMTGMSSDSYVDDWDEDSFTGGSSASGLPSRGPSAAAMTGSASMSNLGGNAGRDTGTGIHSGPSSASMAGTASMSNLGGNAGRETGTGMPGMGLEPSKQSQVGLGGTRTSPVGLGGARTSPVGLGGAGTSPVGLGGARTSPGEHNSGLQAPAPDPVSPLGPTASNPDNNTGGPAGARRRRPR